MPGGKRGIAALILLFSAVVTDPLAAASHGPLLGIGNKVRRLVEHALPGDPVTPQLVLPADSQGSTVDPSRLDHPVALEHELRTALREPIARTRLTVRGGIARIGEYSVGSAETVHGHVVVLEGNAEVHGRVEGNVVTLDGDVIVHPGGSILGDVLAIGGQVRNEGGSISGTMQELAATPVTIASAPSPPVLSLVMRRIIGLGGVVLALVILGFGLVAFGRPNLEIVSDTVSHSFGRSLLVGLLAQVLVLPTFGMLVVGLVLTVAGALLVPFAVAVYALLAIIAVVGGMLAVAHAMGETVTRRRMARGLALSPNSYRYLLTGLSGLAALWLAWAIAGWVPVAGGVIFALALLGTWLAGTIGFGAALLSRGGIRERFGGRVLPPEMMTDEYLWATPRFGVTAVQRPSPSRTDSE